MIKTLTGHLTATKKRHIEQMIANGMTDARSPRIEYHLSRTGETGSEWRVESRTREDNGWGVMVTHQSFATFEHSPS